MGKILLLFFFYTKCELYLIKTRMWFSSAECYVKIRDNQCVKLEI